MASTQLTPGTTHRDSRTPTPPRRRLRLKAVAAVAAAALLVPIGVQIAGLPIWADPFEQEVIDRSPGTLLLALRDVAEFRAATGDFQVLVDVEHDTPYLPDIISGERTTFFAVGHVDALVDFSALGPERMTVSPDRRTAAITLPTPTLARAVVDPEQSRVVGRERGIAERLSGLIEDSPTSEQELYVLAGQKLDAAAQQSDLTPRAEESTRRMLTSLAQSMGFDRIDVTFAGPAPGP